MQSVRDCHDSTIAMKHLDNLVINIIVVWSTRSKKFS